MTTVQCTINFEFHSRDEQLLSKWKEPVTKNLYLEILGSPMRPCLRTVRKTEIDEENDLGTYDNGPKVRANTNNTWQLLAQDSQRMLPRSPHQAIKKKVIT